MHAGKGKLFQMMTMRLIPSIILGKRQAAAAQKMQTL